MITPLSLAIVATVLAAAPARSSAPACFPSLAALDVAVAQLERGGPVEPFWARVRACGRMPLVFGDTAIFFHRSNADRVEWRGDFTGWSSAPSARGRKIGASEIWTFRRTFDRDARLDYKIVETRETWRVDPLNPFQQLGGYGPNSELRMPGWKPPAHAVWRPGVPRGAFPPAEAIHSKSLGYSVNVRVYVPARTAGAVLPILYVTDGSDYWHEAMGGLSTALDNLVAEGRIAPVVVVFVDPWDAAHARNRRDEELVPNARAPGTPIEACRFCTFLVDELAPIVEARLRIDPARRGILGTSLGGFLAAFMTYRYPDRFPLAGIQSPSLGPQAWLPAAIAGAKRPGCRVAIDVGTYEEQFLRDARALRHAFEESGAEVSYREVHDGHSWGHWRATVADVLAFLYPPEASGRR
ncbi:alpha/beta hydrolase [Anaeromyxobacter oryzae]|uniref:Esterase n=1 Tax=Anaeromyxobacter oryzae TaxID=2918170 RepID=A0ABM7WVH4_9BACT|nr:alpha/beta hydrolase-fold protein [Anaeromyxobacter oryzae]BDG03489.1 hypothetical protein AMOR_24850 [Anaeromyxobacter oryzae]